MTDVRIPLGDDVAIECDADGPVLVCTPQQARTIAASCMREAGDRPGMQPGVMDAER